MNYIAHKRFKGKGLSGYTNIPATTELDCQGNIIFYNDKPLCLTTSENAHQYFARNDDGKGLTRGKLTQYILKRLAKRDRNYDIRWNKIWNDKVCAAFKREEFSDYWLWNHAWYEADIVTLTYIANLIT